MTECDETDTGPLAAGRRVAVVIGSTRPNRICAEVAAWCLPRLRAGSDLRYETVDLVEVNLPFLDEPLKAALGRYEHEHTRAWSRLVSSFDAFVFVFPQYNWGYPAPLKNALDFLYAEWHDKPAGLVTYGTRGGEKGATQLRGVLQGIHMRTVDHNVELRIADDDVDPDGQLLDVEETLAPFAPAVRALDDQLSEALLSDRTVDPAAPARRDNGPPGGQTDAGDSSPSI